MWSISVIDSMNGTIELKMEKIEYENSAMFQFWVD